MPVTHRPAQVLPVIRGPIVAGSGSAAATTSRGATSTGPFVERTRTGRRRVEPEQVQHPQHVDELLAEAVLERHPLRVDPARHEEHLFVLDVHALDRADALGELEHLGLAERRGREPAGVLLPDHGRIQALLDRGPDRERRREDLVALVVGDDEVGAVAHAELVDPARTGGRPRSGRTRRRGPARRPCPRARGAPRHCQSPACANWSSPSFTPGLLVGVGRMRLRQAHRHVEVVGAGRERAREDRRHELRLDGVHHVRRTVLAGDGCHDVGIRRVDLRRGEPGGDLVAVLRP